MEESKKVVVLLEGYNRLEDHVIGQENECGQVLRGLVFFNAWRYESHSGTFYTLGKGEIYYTSGAQKLNTTSSTETEVVAVGEKLPKYIWF